MLVVDAMNVVGARPDGWWRDRAAAIRALAERLRRLADVDQTPVVMVIDGRPVEELEEGERGWLEVRYAARRGPDAADDRIIDLLADLPAPVTIVTADRELRARAQALGADVLGPAALLARLDALDRP